MRDCWEHHVRLLQSESAPPKHVVALLMSTISVKITKLPENLRIKTAGRVKIPCMSSSTTSESLSDLLPEATLRAQINSANRIVVKIGSSALPQEDFSVPRDKIDRIVDAVVKRIETTDVIIVSSGTVAAGMRPLGLNQRPLGLADKQATASVGQIHLANEWSRSFARHGRTVGQVLLTASDTGQRDRTRNAKRTIDKLLHWGVVPIVNRSEERRVGKECRYRRVAYH